VTSETRAAGALAGSRTAPGWAWPRTFTSAICCPSSRATTHAERPTAGSALIPTGI